MNTHHLQPGRILELNFPLGSLKGVGPKKVQTLARKGLHTLLDLLCFTPKRYEDRTRFVPIDDARDGEAVLVSGKVLFGGEQRFLRTGKRLFRIVVTDGGTNLELLWFHYRTAHLCRFSRRGLRLAAYGRMKKERGRTTMIHPDLSILEPSKEESLLGFYPVYPSVEGLSGNALRSLVNQALELCKNEIIDPLPREVVERLSLPGLAEAVKGVHAPPKDCSLEALNQFRTEFQRRLLFDRFFHVMLCIALRKKVQKAREGIKFSIPPDLIRRFEAGLPFALTGGQVQAVEAILKDMSSGKPMNRLIQGDVGCGKTVVAMAACCATIRNGWQVSVMVPTQVLASQHYDAFSRLPPELGLFPALVTGELKKKERVEIYEKIKNGHYNVIIGTQALIQEGVCFSRLGLVVIDEQQRFGVRQRGALDRKGANPHLLVMTATPIPRTLAMAVYADLDLSLISEYPGGPRKVLTHLVEESRKRWVFELIKARLSAGQQAIVICPVIEESEETDLKSALEMHEKLKKAYSPSFRVGLIHGRLAPGEKDRTMRRFATGEIDLLVGTTVIEVGVHAPGATVMVVEHPERFGLSQLHQLRGRVGRGSEGGLCLLMLRNDLQPSTLKRLEILSQTNDGFEIAQKDLELRGQGELMGIRQAGAGELDLGEILREPELLVAANREAERIVHSDPDLSRPENRILREIAQSVVCEEQIF